MGYSSLEGNLMMTQLQKFQISDPLGCAKTSKKSSCFPRVQEVSQTSNNEKLPGG